MGRNVFMGAAVSLVLLSTAWGRSVRVYIGAYTGGDASKGIYRSSLDLQTGELAAPVLAAQVRDPSFIEMHPSGKFLYAVSEAGAEGRVFAYAIDPNTGDLALVNDASTGGAGPCYVNVDHAGRRVLVANYNSGSASVLPIRPDGGLGEPTGFVQHEGSSVNPSRQKEPHAHSINPSPDDRFVFVADLGLDKILIYKLDGVSGKITANNPAFAQVKAGAGPRHFVFHPGGLYAYVINELDSTITAFMYDAVRGSLGEIQTVSTLPVGFNGPSWCAEIRVHPSGRFLYGSNRGHDSIAVCRIDPTTGLLTLVEYETDGIKVPRNFNIEPTGKFCLVANQNGDSVVVFRIDEKTGALEPTGQKVKVSKPVCIRFL